MGYVDHTPTSFRNAVTHSAMLYSADGGVDYSTHSALVEDGKASDISGMWLENGILSSRAAKAALTGLPQQAQTGTLHSVYSFCGSVLMHIGTILCRLTSGEFTVLQENLPDHKSIPVEFGGALYLYVNTYIYRTDRLFHTEEVLPTPALYKTDCHSYLPTSQTVSGFKPNIFAPYVAITYKKETNDSRSGYRLPDIDKTRPFQIYFEDRLLEETEYVMYEDKFELVGLTETVENSVKLCYYSTSAKLNKSDLLSGCTCGTSFGGGTLTGTRVFLGGNPNEPGKYYMSELSDPLCFFEDSCGTVGESAGNITGFAKQQSYLLVFTDTTVSRMSYHYTSENGGYFTTKTINASTGCDMPGSIASVDNRTVFASSTGGIYVVDSTELYDGMNILPISQNITDLSRKKGYTAIPSDVLKAAKSAVFERKYILYVEDKWFIWDYGAKAYTASSDNAKTAKKLAWFVFDGMEKGFSLFSDGMSLYSFGNIGIQNTLYLFKTASAEQDGTADEEEPAFLFRSGNSDLNCPHTRKNVTGFALECRIAKQTELELEFFGDGRRIKSTQVLLSPRADGYASCYIKLPSQTLERFLFCIRGKGAHVGIFNLRIDYRLCKQQHLRNII